MTRLVVCLFAISIFQNGILKLAQANETSTEGLTNNDETTKATEVEKSAIQETTTNKPTEKHAKDNGLNKVLTDITKSTDLLKGNPAENANNFSRNFLGPVHTVRVKIGEAVTKGMDTAKDLADGTFNFFRSTIHGGLM